MTIPTETMHEILRKLTPAIGRVLAQRRKTRPCTDPCHHVSWCSTCNAMEDVNEALEQVLDPDIVEAVVLKQLIFFDSYTELRINDTTYGVALDSPVNADAGGFFKIIWTIGDQDHEYTAKATDLPALVEKAWAK